MLKVYKEILFSFPKLQNKNTSMKEVYRSIKIAEIYANWVGKKIEERV